MPLLLNRVRLRRTLAAGGRAPRVAVIGAGLSGLGLAAQLQQAGVGDITVFEKSDGPGGTWRDNSYPGAACDVPSHLYSFSFFRKADWSLKFSPQPEILEYVDDMVEHFALAPLLRFGHEVTAAVYDEDAGEWVLTVRSEGGPEAEHRADVLVAATGQLSLPAIPEIPGVESFAGTAFHSARWDHEHDLEGQRVAVVGNGASAVQFVPPVAEQAGHTTIFQRSANYVGPKRDGVFSERAKRAFAAVPLVERLYRWSIYWRFEARWTWFLQGSWVGERLRKLFAAGIKDGLVDAGGLPEEAVLPDYPLGCKRVLISNDLYPTLLRHDVRVVTESITRITEHGVVTADGEEHQADTLIWGTGFQATRFLAPVEVIGTGGISLQREWKDGAEANLGLTVVGFPNLFLLYGPNTNLGHNSILFMVERQIDYILQCVRHLAITGRPLELTSDAQVAGTADIGRRMLKTVWAAGCRSWYKTATGRVTNNWPGSTLQYWARTLRPRWTDFR